MELSQAIEAIRDRHQGVLVTRRRDGSAQLSNIVFAYADNPPGTALRSPGTARISVTDSRAKTRNLRRDPRASLYVPGDTFWSYVVLDGTAYLSPVASFPDDAVADELADVYRVIAGHDHPDWAEFRAVMVEEARLVVRFRPTSAYGQLPG